MQANEDGLKQGGIIFEAGAQIDDVDCSWMMAPWKEISYQGLAPTTPIKIRLM